MTPANPAVTGKGTLDYIPMWDSASDIVNSVIFQKTSKVGISTTSPAQLLDVNGKTDIRDTLTLFPNSTDNTLGVSGTSFKVSSTGLVTFISGQTFPGAGTITGVTTATGSGLSGGGTTGSLSLKVPSAGITNAMLQNSKVTLNASTAGGLTVPGAMTLGSTYTIGLKTCSTNQVLQYSGTAWNCATIGGTGTITGVTAGTDLTGGGTTGTVTLNLDTTKVPLLAAANTFTGTDRFNGNVGIGAAPFSNTYTPLALGGSTTFGTWLSLANTSAGGHTWNFLSAGSANGEGAGNLGITDLTGTSTIWLEGNANVSSTLQIGSNLIVERQRCERWRRDSRCSVWRKRERRKYCIGPDRWIQPVRPRPLHKLYVQDVNTQRRPGRHRHTNPVLPNGRHYKIECVQRNPRRWSFRRVGFGPERELGRLWFWRGR